MQIYHDIMVAWSWQ